MPHLPLLSVFKLFMLEFNTMSDGCITLGVYLLLIAACGLGLWAVIKKRLKLIAPAILFPFVCAFTVMAWKADIREHAGMIYLKNAQAQEKGIISSRVFGQVINTIMQNIMPVSDDARNVDFSNVVQQEMSLKILGWKTSRSETYIFIKVIQHDNPAPEHALVYRIGMVDVLNGLGTLQQSHDRDNKKNVAHDQAFREAQKDFESLGF